MISAPGSPNIKIDMNIVGLPPGMIITLSGDTSTLKRLARSAATASRNGRNAVGGRIAMMTVAQRFYRRLDDEIGRPEVGLADAEIDDVTALRDQRIGAGKHREGVFLANTIEGRDCTKHNCNPPARALSRHRREGASSMRRAVQPIRRKKSNADGSSPNAEALNGRRQNGR